MPTALRVSAARSAARSASSGASALISLGEQLDDPFGAHPKFGAVEQLGEGDPGGALPCLAGNPGTPDAAVDGGLGAAGVVTVEVARRDGLQDVDVDDRAAHCALLGGGGLARHGGLVGGALPGGGLIEVATP